MAAAKTKLKIEQGATFRKVFIWKAAGVPVDLTGWTGRMQIRPDVASDEVIASLTTENGGIDIEDAGTFVLYLSSEQTTAMTFDSAVFDLELVAPNGDVTRLMQGVVTLSPQVTR
ncbi:MAG: hypothetical protein KA742_13940 [Pseudoxanthomonas sp.]|nr:hypothetical protein [Pseudoxanthomonas sp.]